MRVGRHGTVNVERDVTIGAYVRLECVKPVVGRVSDLQKDLVVFLRFLHAELACLVVQDQELARVLNTLVADLGKTARVLVEVC